MQNLLTPAAFLAWVEKQSADKHYDYTDNHQCPIAQYLDHIGVKHCGVSGLGMWYSENYQERRAFVNSDLINNAGESRTFGALADRLRAAQ